MVRDSWKSDVETVADALMRGGSDAFSANARKLHAILCMGPPEVAAALGIPCPPDRLDALFAIDARREASLELIGRSAFSVSRDEAGAIATVWAANLFPPTEAVAADEATAVLQAFSVGLRDWARAISMVSSSTATH